MVKKFASFVTAAALLVTMICIPASAELTVISEESYSDMNQTFTPLDLKEAANMGFADEVAGDGIGGWTDQGAINDMSGFDLRGRVNLRGVDFDIIDPEKNNGKSVITLSGQNAEAISNTAEIPVNQRAAGVYFLHAAAYVTDNIAVYTFVYEDGSRHQVPIRNNIEVFNFWGTGSSDVCKTAWNGSNASSTSVSIYFYAMENPYPEKTISRLELSTTGKDAFCMVAAATLTDKGPYMMDELDRGNPDTATWYPYEMPTHETIVGTVLDCSWLLDAPAGKHGRLRTDGSRLFFEDGTEANFWGTNISEGVFASHDRLDKIINRMAACGFNLVRIHNYMISSAGPRALYASPKMGKEFNPQRVDQLCYAISKFKEKGIYIFLDLHTARNKFEDDNIRGARDASISQTDIKNSYWFDSELQRIDETFVRELLDTYNPYTGMRLADDPAIVFSDQTNETAFYGLTRSGGKYYDEDIRKLYCAWLREKYGSDEALRKAWQYLGKEGLLEGESLEDYSVAFGYQGEREKYVKPRHDDNLHFIADTMSTYYENQKKLTDELGYGALITSTQNWGGPGPAMLYTLIDCDFIDSHAYWSHPDQNFMMQKGTAMGGNMPISMLEDKSLGIIGQFFNDTVYDMPHTLTEWDECDLNPTMAEQFTLMAAYSSLHNWVPMNFAFSSQGDEATEILQSTGPRYNLYVDNYTGDPNAIRNFWSLSNNPVKMGCITAASIMKLRGDIKRADRGFYHRYSQNNYFDSNHQAFSQPPYLGMIGRTGVAYDKKSYDRDYNDNEILYKAFMSNKKGLPFISDTGEIYTDLKNAVFQINTAFSQAVTGRISGQSFEVDDMIVEVTNPFANINLTSLTSDPIWDADRLLLTAAGDQRNTDEVRSKDGTAVVRGGTAPVLAEPIVGRITLKTKDDITVYTISSTGRRHKTARVEKDENGYAVICLRAEDACMNYEIVREKKAPGARAANKHIEFDEIEVKPLFNDLAGYEWAEKQITRNALLGQMSGISETEFAPGADITKGDYIAALVNVCRLKTPVTENFADVSENDPNYTAIGIAKAFGVVNGDEHDCVDPGGSISRQDALTILDRALAAGGVRVKKATGEELKHCRDRDRISEYAADCVSRMLAQGYVSGLFSGVSFEPEKTLTRAEAACMIYGVLWE